MKRVGDLDDGREVDPDVVFNPVLVLGVSLFGHFEVLEDICSWAAIKYRLNHTLATRHPFFVGFDEA